MYCIYKDGQLWLSYRTPPITKLSLFMPTSGSGFVFVTMVTRMRKDREKETGEGEREREVSTCVKWSGSNFWNVVLHRTEGLILLDRQTNTVTHTGSLRVYGLVQPRARLLISRAFGRRLWALMFTTVNWNGPFYPQEARMQPVSFRLSRCVFNKFVTWDK